MMVIAGIVLIGGAGIAVSASTSQESLETIERIIPVSTDGELDDVNSSRTVEGPQITVKEAKEIALAQFDNGRVKEIELENENGHYMYEVEIKVHGEDGDVYVDAMNGEIIYVDDDLLQMDSGNEQRNHSNETISEMITAQEALEIAFNHIGEKGEVDELELERDENRFKYEIEIELSNDREVEFIIDANTGEILSVEWDD